MRWIYCVATARSDYKSCSSPTTGYDVIMGMFHNGSDRTSSHRLLTVASEHIGPSHGYYKTA